MWELYTISLLEKSQGKMVCERWRVGTDRINRRLNESDYKVEKRCLSSQILCSPTKQQNKRLSSQQKSHNSGKEVRYNPSSNWTPYDRFKTLPIKLCRHPT